MHLPKDPINSQVNILPSLNHLSFFCSHQEEFLKLWLLCSCNIDVCLGFSVQVLRVKPMIHVFS